MSSVDSHTIGAIFWMASTCSVWQHSSSSTLHVCPLQSPSEVSSVSHFISTPNLKFQILIVLQWNNQPRYYRHSFFRYIYCNTVRCVISEVESVRCSLIEWYKCLKMFLLNNLYSNEVHCVIDLRLWCAYVILVLITEHMCLNYILMRHNVAGDKTDQWMGVTEMMVSTAICGILFAIFSGQPLIVIGATGPVVIFEEALYKVSF